MVLTKENERNISQRSRPASVKSDRSVHKESRIPRQKRTTHIPTSSKPQKDTSSKDFKNPSEIQQKSHHDNTSANTQKKTRSELLAEWREKKGMKSTRNPLTTKKQQVVTKTTNDRSSRIHSTTTTTSKKPSKQPLSLLMKSRVNSAKEMASRGTKQHIENAKNRLAQITDKDALPLFIAMNIQEDSREKLKLQKQLSSILETNTTLFKMSEYWGARSFVEWCSGDLESSVYLIQLAQYTKSQPLHSILESIQYVLKELKKECLILFSDAPKSSYLNNITPLLSSIKILQNLELISPTILKKLSEYENRLSQFSYSPDDLLVLSPVPPVVKMNSSVIKECHNQEELESAQEEITEDVIPTPIQYPGNNDDDCEQDDFDEKENSDDNSTIMEDSDEEEGDIDDKDDEIMDLHDNVNSHKVENQKDFDSQNDTSDDSSEEIIIESSEEIIIESSSEENMVDEDDITESESIDEDETQNTDFKLELTEDITTSPQYFESIIKSNNIQNTPSSIPPQSELKSPEFLPNPIPISERLDLGKDPLSPQLTSIDDMDDSEEEEKTKIIPSTPNDKMISTSSTYTPGRVNTPLMNKLRSKRRSSALMPSPSPFIRGSQPLRVTPKDARKQVKQSFGKTRATVDALEFYRRKSILYKASVNDMVNDLFADEEIFDDFPDSSDTLLLMNTPTPPNSPTKALPIIGTPLRSNTTKNGRPMTPIPSELIGLLEEQKKKKDELLASKKQADSDLQGSVIVMTPVNTSKKEQTICNSAQKLTNVRRSVRKHKDSICTPSKEDRSQLLEYCNYSYEANNRILFVEKEPLMVLSDTLDKLKISEKNDEFLEMPENVSFALNLLENEENEKKSKSTQKKQKQKNDTRNDEKSDDVINFEEKKKEEKKNAPASTKKPKVQPTRVSTRKRRQTQWY